MHLEHITMTISGVGAHGAAHRDHRRPVDDGAFLLVCLGLLPPLMMLLMWNHPAQTMSERIDEARR